MASSLGVLRFDVLPGEANRRGRRHSTTDDGINVTVLAVWRSGVANTSPSVSIRGYLRDERPITKQIP